MSSNAAVQSTTSKKQKVKPKPKTPPDIDVSMYVIDANGTPVQGLTFKVTTVSGEESVVTDASGRTTSFKVKPKNAVPIQVKKKEGNFKLLGDFKAKCDQQVIRIVSPASIAEAQLFPHEGGPNANLAQNETENKKPGTIEKKRDKKGQPVCQVFVECPNDENLRLVENFEYREIIISASERANMNPLALAALINAEAAKDRRTGVWLPSSTNGNAVGLTQFLPGTFIGFSEIKGTWLHEKAMAEGFLIEKNSGKAVKSKKKGKTTPSNINKTQKVIDPTKKDEWLNKRLLPEYSIQAAVDYGLENLKKLKKANLDIDSLGDAELAKVMYLAHHDDAYWVVKIIDETMSETEAKKRLKANTDESEEDLVDRYDAENQSWIKAYKSWLFEMIDNRIILSKFACDPTKVPKAKSLNEILTSSAP